METLRDRLEADLKIGGYSQVPGVLPALQAVRTATGRKPDSHRTPALGVTRTPLHHLVGGEGAHF